MNQDEFKVEHDKIRLQRDQSIKLADLVREFQVANSITDEYLQFILIQMTYALSSTIEDNRDIARYRSMKTCGEG